MGYVTLPSGRRVNNTCAWSGDCWANGGCYPQTECAETEWDRLVATAQLEHELDLVPHTDPDVTFACRRCQ